MSFCYLEMVGCCFTRVQGCVVPTLGVDVMRRGFHLLLLECGLWLCIAIWCVWSSRVDCLLMVALYAFCEEGIRGLLYGMLYGSCFGVLEESVAVWCNLCVSVTKCDVCVWRPIDSIW